jgi:hypothetical protein
MAQISYLAKLRADVRLGELEYPLFVSKISPIGLLFSALLEKAFYSFFSISREAFL